MKDALRFTVPFKKQVRMIVSTDAKNEADDQFAIAHHLMTPMFDVKAIIPAHFEANPRYGKGKTMQASYDEVMLMLDLMELTGKYPVPKGAVYPLVDENTPQDSEGARFIIEEAHKDDVRPLFIGVQGAITDVASALLIDPTIADKIHVIWIGGGEYPHGGSEFNLMNDVHAANVVFDSGVDLWQVPKNVYKMLNLTLAELQCRVAPCGKVGEYLFRQMVEFNDSLGEMLRWPHGESWCIGDQPTVGLLLEDKEVQHYTMQHAPRVNPDLTYTLRDDSPMIRVYHTTDARLTLEDFYCKLKLFFG